MNKTDWQQDLRNYIKESAKRDQACYFEEVLKRDKRFEIFYHLSQMREALFNWYDFKKDSDLLEVGGEYGALSGLFSDRCKSVTVTERNAVRAETIRQRYIEKKNLKVLTGDITDLEPGEDFDYIVTLVLPREEETRTAFLEKLSGLLKRGGKLLFACDNRLGVHELCGGTQPYALAKPFAGLNGGGRYMYTRTELEDILKKAGFMGRKFYYPLPDYRFPQLLFSDAYLPQTRLSERFIPYYYDRNTVIADERKLLEQFANEGLFTRFTNSFLVECGKEEAENAEADFAAITMDRIRQQRCITKIYKKKVRKESADSEGYVNIKQVYQNSLELQKKGILTVRQDWKDNGIEMSFMSEPLLSACLGRIAKNNKQEYIRIFDQMYADVLKASDQVADDQNVLLEEGTRDCEWGPILKKVYMEMIPMNCFYREQDQALIYFDQEFVRENYPAKYALYRALRNTYIFIPEVEKQVPLAEMKARYHMEQIWHILEREDDRFLCELRDQAETRNFRKWSGVDYGRMEANRSRLAGCEKTDKI